MHNELVQLLILNNTLPELHGFLHNSFGLLLHVAKLCSNFLEVGLTLRNLLRWGSGMCLSLEQSVMVMQWNQGLPQSLGLLNWGELGGGIKHVLTCRRDNLL